MKLQRVNKYYVIINAIYVQTRNHATLMHILMIDNVIGNYLFEYLQLSKFGLRKRTGCQMLCV